MNKMMLKKQYIMYAPKKKGRLPSGYQEVEYIQGTGTQYINTLVIPTSKTSWEIEFEQTEKTDVWYFGVDTGWETNAFGFNVHKKYLTTDIYPLLYINSSGLFENFETLEANQRYVVKYGNGLLRVNSTEYSVPSFTGTLTNPIYTNSINRNGTPDSIAQGKGKIYSLKFYEDNTIIRDFIPCYRKSDNEIGMYDIVNNQFYTNAGSGTFLMGRPLVYYTISGYRQVDYIAGNNAYIEFPYVTNGYNIGFDISFDIPSISLTSDAKIIQNDYLNDYVPIGMTLTRINVTYFGSYSTVSPTYWSNDTYTYNEDRYLINYKNSNVISSIGKSNWSHTLNKSLNDVAITFFTFMSVGVPSTFHLKSLDMTDGDNIVARFIPMEETSTGLVGLYDLVGKKFYSSQTNNNFIKGDYI